MSVVTTTINWYDTLIIGLLVLTYVAKAWWIERETFFGWLMCFQATVLASVFGYAFMRRLDPGLSEWPLSVLRAFLLVSCILTLGTLVYKKAYVVRLRRGSVDRLRGPDALANLARRVSGLRAGWRRPKL